MDRGLPDPVRHLQHSKNLKEPARIDPFEALRTAGFQVLGHSCFSARPFSVRETCVPIDPALGLSALPEDVDFEAFVRQSEHLGAWCADKLPSLTALARRPDLVPHHDGCRGLDGFSAHPAPPPIIIH